MHCPQIQNLLLYCVGYSEDGSRPCYHYATDVTRRLSEDLGDLRSQVQDFEAVLLTELVQRLWRRSGELGRAAAAAAELDCMLSLAGAATDLDLRRPR
jgi:DNA mismatch repair ATPase MutS